MDFLNFFGAGIKGDNDVSFFNPNSFEPDKILGVIKNLVDLPAFGNKEVNKEEIPDSSSNQSQEQEQDVPENNNLSKTPFSVNLPKSISPVLSKPLPNAGGILGLIAQVESGNNNHIVSGGKLDPNMLNSTIAQLHKKYRQKALGLYQIQMPTAINVLRENNVDPKTFVFNESGQKQIAQMLLRKRGYGTTSDKKALAKNLAKEWAALPYNENNESYYKGIQNNKALIDFTTLLNSLG
jgi:hypothetical protein